MPVLCNRESGREGKGKLTGTPHYSTKLELCRKGLLIRDGKVIPGELIGLTQGTVFLSTNLLQQNATNKMMDLRFKTLSLAHHRETLCE